MNHLGNTRHGNGLCVPVIETWEANYYAEETERESSAFAVSAQEACGAGPWKKLGNWLFARTCLAASVGGVFGAEYSLMVLLIQSWASRFQTSEHLATGSEMNYVQQCVFLMVRALRYVAPDAVRKAMRNDA